MDQGTALEPSHETIHAIDMSSNEKDGNGPMNRALAEYNTSTDHNREKHQQEATLDGGTDENRADRKGTVDTDPYSVRWLRAMNINEDSLYFAMWSVSWKLPGLMITKTWGTLATSFDDTTTMTGSKHSAITLMKL